MATIDEKKLAEIKETYKQQFGIDPDVIDGMAQVCLYMTNEWEKVLEKEQKRYEQINKEYRERKRKALRQFDFFEEIRTDNKFIDRYKNFQYKPNGGFIRGKNDYKYKR